MKTVGNKIKELRRSAGMSQKDIADKLGVSSQAVSKWENDASLPEMTMLPDIASLFGVQIDDLFEYSTEKRYESIRMKLEYNRDLSNKEFESEESFLLREIEANPEKREAISLLGSLYRHHAESLHKKQVFFAKRALALQPNNKEDINNINNGWGGVLFDWDTANHHELIAYWKDLLKKQPENKRVYFYLLDNLIDDGRLQEARDVLADSQKKNPDVLNAFYEVFIEEHELGFPSVEADYKKLRDMYHEDWRMLFSIANAYSYHERYQDAIELWQQTFDAMPKPRYTDPYEAMAQCCLRMGDKKKAAAYYKLELELLKEDWGIKYGADVEKLEEKIRINEAEASVKE